MHHTAAWRFDSDAETWTNRLESYASEFNLDHLAVLDAASWCLLWDRQICLELVADTPKGNETSVLQTWILGAEVPGKTPFWEHRKLIALSLERLGLIDVSRASRLSDATGPADAFSVLIWDLVRSQTRRCLDDLSLQGRDVFLSKTAAMVDPDRLFQTQGGQRIDSDMQTSYWGHWYPGLSIADRKLCDCIASLPGASDVDIPEVVRRLENPVSPLALPGAVTLRRHDVLHILLGRGLLDQDEAFVVGFTMGNATRYRDADGALMREALEHWYPEPFRIFGTKLRVFDLGVQAGKCMGIPDIAQIPVENLGSFTVGHARQELKISEEKLREFYRQEKRLSPTSLESGRLP